MAIALQAGDMFVTLPLDIAKLAGALVGALMGVLAARALAAGALVVGVLAVGALAHQQKNSCIAMPHQALQRDFYVTSVRTLANVPLSYIRSQFFFSLNLPCNALHLISCPGYTYFMLYPFSIPYVT